MPRVHASIGRLIESARRLRDLAGELGQVELKSRIVDEISTLQELRDGFDDEGHSSPRASSADSLAAADSAAAGKSATAVKLPIEGKSTPLGDHSMAVFQTSGTIETYGIAAESESDRDEAVDNESTDDELIDDVDEVEIIEEAPDVAAKPDRVGKSASNTADLENRQRLAARAELQIAELEPLLLAATRRVNSVLTPEQNQIRVKATKAARAAGKTGHEANQYVYAAMNLSDEQKAELAAARKDVNVLRAAVSREVDALTDETRKQQLISQLHLK